MIYSPRMILHHDSCDHDDTNARVVSEDEGIHEVEVMWKRGREKVRATEHSIVEMLTREKIAKRL